jgi:hypothetical protein
VDRNDVMEYVTRSEAWERSAAEIRAAARARTLFGATEDYLDVLAGTRPWSVEEHREVLEEMAAAWLSRGGEDWLPGLDRAWVAEHVRERPRRDRLSGGVVVDEFLRWAADEGLISAR